MEFFNGGSGVSDQSEASIEQVSVTLANPSRGSFSAILNLPGAAVCELAVYDVSGRLVGTLVSGTVPTGSHTFTLSGTDLSNGTYLVSGYAGTERISERTVLLK
jgi:flagellar hook assembly protein FlgD